MNQKICNLLKGKYENHIMPFFWQHGEDEATLRKYMEVIQASGCGAVCVESRPHPDFCGPKWWADMDVILDEARNRQMKVWILDDSHFPTGYANGALENVPAELCRQSVFCNTETFDGTANTIKIDIDGLSKPTKLKLSKIAEMASQMSPPPRCFDDDKILSVSAVFQDDGTVVDLTANIHDGELVWEKPEGKWTVHVCGLSHNCGPHRNYINMMDTESCKMLLDAVYEPHWQHYKEDFGTTITGFFSDEPELGNGILYMQNNPIGTEQDLPWSAELENDISTRLGDMWKLLLPHLWCQDSGAKEAARVRFVYMDAVTRLVQKDFSEQIGGWCRAHSVEYIGHVIEDEGQHCRTASSLGHYFRGLAGQDMAGIDDIGGQVMPGGEDEPTEGPLGRTRGGELYHYGIGPLAATAAAIEPRKKGRAMCEIFGNYGWKEGVQLEKYLADHFLVQGINNFVPHAFSAKAYPDPDCPPHFYADGHDPLYRHFGKLIRYMNRVCELISGGTRIAPVAVLYHAEAEWTGNSMPFEKPLRKMYDRQFCCDVIPADVFAQLKEYNTQIGTALKVNTQEYKALVIPFAQFITSATAKAIVALHKAGFPVFFVDSLPEGICDGDDALLEGVKSCDVVLLDEIADAIEKLGVSEIKLIPSNNRVRVLHYKGESDIFMLVNEDTQVYHGTVSVPCSSPCYGYDAMENQLLQISLIPSEKGVNFNIDLEPLKSQLIIFDDPGSELLHKPLLPNGNAENLNSWTRSLCRGIKYPKFAGEKNVTLPDKLAQEDSAFSGFVRYETTFQSVENEKMILEITDAAEAVEVFINGKSMGLEFLPPIRYDLTGCTKDGKNTLSIEVATTLERERAAAAQDFFEKIMAGEPTGGSGLTGTVTLYRG